MAPNSSTQDPPPPVRPSGPLPVPQSKYTRTSLPLQIPSGVWGQKAPSAQPMKASTGTISWGALPVSTRNVLQTPYGAFLDPSLISLTLRSLDSPSRAASFLSVPYSGKWSWKCLKYARTISGAGASQPSHSLRRWFREYKASSTSVCGGSVLALRFSLS